MVPSLSTSSHWDTDQMPYLSILDTDSLHWNWQVRRYLDGDIFAFSDVKSRNFWQEEKIEKHEAVWLRIIEFNFLSSGWFFVQSLDSKRQRVAHMMWAHDGGPTSAWCTPRWPGSPHCQPLFEAASVHSQLRHPGRGGVHLLAHKYKYKIQIIVQCIHAIKSEKASRILIASYFA